MTRDEIDLRSDTVTRPGQAMREAMATAVVGDAVWGDDPTVTELEEKTAALLGKQAGLFVPSGTQSNLCALMAHCQRGEEYIVGQNAHTYKYEAGGSAVLGSIQPQPLEFEPDGTLDLDLVRSKIKPDDPHFAQTTLLSLENTHDGKVLPMSYLSDARAFADEMGISLHLDGARVWNASAALGIPVENIAASFDSVSVCLSKGLGAPVGSVLVGNQDLIDRAIRWRKMLGGGMRQAGILAAAGIYALDHHRDRLVEDHQMARSIAEQLGGVSGVNVLDVQTNMVFVEFSDFAGDAAAGLANEGIIAAVQAGPSRFVTHLDLPHDTPERLAAALTNAQGV
ncbi:MAG: low-specificity L-threonine aldolase [Acidimicrobiia bacterium]|nr:low-specificity L-threonine aldolase [Acidimicrobiia bacterium]